MKRLLNISLGIGIGVTLVTSLQAFANTSLDLSDSYRSSMSSALTTEEQEAEETQATIDAITAAANQALADANTELAAATADYAEVVSNSTSQKFSIKRYCDDTKKTVTASAVLGGTLEMPCQ